MVVDSFYLSVIPSWISQRLESVVVYLEENRQQLFYLLGFYVVTIALFIERFMREYRVKLMIFLALISYFPSQFISFLMDNLYYQFKK